MIGRFLLCLVLGILINSVIQHGLRSMGVDNELNLLIGLGVGFITYTVMSDWINDR